MKKEIHPDYFETTVTCGCGNVIEVKATVADMKIDVCSECHPFFTGKQKLLDVAGRVEKFNRKYGRKSQ